MSRKMIIALAATAMLGAAAITDIAAARMGGHGGHGGFGGHGRAIGGMHGGWHGGFRSHFAGHRPFIGHHRFVGHHRFAFRHHRFHHRRFLFAASFGYPYYGDCFVVRRVWRPWGWTWRRIWVCG